MTFAAIGKYAQRPDVAIIHLLSDGYHIEQKSADILSFPTPHRSSS